MAERPETMAAINDAIETAETILATMKSLREVAKLPDVDGPLADAPRGIVLSHLCCAAADQTNQLLTEITVAHRSFGKANA